MIIRRILIMVMALATASGAGVYAHSRFGNGKCFFGCPSGTCVFNSTCNKNGNNCRCSWSDGLKCISC